MSSTPRFLRSVRDAEPEPRAFGRLNPETEDLARAVDSHPERDVDRLLDHGPAVPDADEKRVEVQDRIHRFERADLPVLDLVDDRVGHARDQIPVDTSVP